MTGSIVFDIFVAIGIYMTLTFVGKRSGLAMSSDSFMVGLIVTVAIVAMMTWVKP